MRHIVIFSESQGWHEEQLGQAFAAHGLRHTVLSLAECRLGFERAPVAIAIPGFEDALPAAAFVRGIPAGSFEQVTFRLDILHALQACGVPVCNPAAAIERTVDKAMTSFLLLKSGVNTPPVWVCESESLAREVIARQVRRGNPLVQKPLFGNCGRGLRLLDDSRCEPDTEMNNGVYYLQRYIAPERRAAGGRCKDWRVFVIGHRAVAIMERASAHWITNRARGGECRPAAWTPALRRLAESASRATGIHYGGIDIIRDRHGEYLVLEVNSVPAWRGLQSVHPRNLAEQLARQLAATVS